LSVTLVYDSARFDGRAVAGLGDQLIHLLKSFAAAPDQRLASHRLVSTTTEEHLRKLDAGPELVEDHRTVLEMVDAVARQRPHAPAVAFEGEVLTYGDLVRRAEGVASRLVEAGVGPSQPVGLCVSRTFEMVVGILAILKAGGAYVPLDPAYPSAHISGLLEGDGIAVVLIGSSAAVDIPDSVTTIPIDSDRPPTGVLPTPPSGDDLAYVIHTSGSTGRPKGVMVTHRNLAASTLARDAHYGAPVGRFLLLSSFAFDSSVVGIFWTLTSGGTLVLPTTGLEQDVDRLLNLARTEQITHLLCLPALYRVLLEQAGGGELASLQVAVVAGEACPPGVLEAHMSLLPDAELHNEYGPTEATVWCTAHHAGSADVGRSLPIGRPIAGSRIHLLDEYGNRVPPGFAGEICVAGAGVTSGYLHRPDLTAERFVTVELDGAPERLYRTGDLACYEPEGTVRFLGRADLQLKIRGHRIETGAVESALRAHPLVAEAAVAGRTGPGRGGVRLVGYVLFTGSEDSARIRADLSESLPEYMVPDVIVSITELPRLPNGKVAYDRLPDPGSIVGEAAEIIPPRTPAEAALAAIWEDLLNVEGVGVNADFFALGGDSIVSIQMISRARQAGVHIEPGQISKHPTIAALAAAASGGEPTAVDSGPLVGPVPLGPIQRWFFESNLTAPQHWNQTGLFQLPEGLDPVVVGRAIQACVDHHDMLRARFEDRGGQWHQIVEPPYPISLEVIDVTTLDPAAAELASHLEGIQSRLDLETGPLVRAAFFRSADSGPALLLLAVHHLIVDAVSWAILIEDLESAIEQAQEGLDVSLPPRTTSYREWVGYLITDDRTDERAFWSNGPPAGGPTDFGLEGSTVVVRSELDDESTRLLLTTVHDAYQTRPEDVLVAALGAAIARRDGATRIRLGLEGHGRPTDVNGMDLSRTVGWFTAYYPLTLNIVPDPAELIKNVKERLRMVPQGGIGYGVLRYLARDRDIVVQENPDILFNYLSRTPGAGSLRRLKPIAGADESSRDPRNERSHAIEVVARIEANRLAVDWYYSQGRDDAQAIHRLAGDFMDSLRRIIDHCVTEGVGGFTPSDFPEAGLDQSELDAFLDGLA
jgi:amino acid adenylation domain-containing protein/non-ribosomal peptide synthase protein (TIGR01720 family)